MGLTREITPAHVPMAPLYQELHRWAVTPFRWGESDCCLIVADWIARVRGADPAAHLRGMYDSAGSCERETGFLSDPVAAVEDVLATIGGLDRVTEPSRGDVAVYQRHGERWAFGGVWTGTDWASKGQEGVTFLKPGEVRPLAIWALGYAE